MRWQRSPREEREEVTVDVALSRKEADPCHRQSQPPPGLHQRCNECLSGWRWLVYQPAAVPCYSAVQPPIYSWIELSRDSQWSDSDFSAPPLFVLFYFLMFLLISYWFYFLFSCADDDLVPPAVSQSCWTHAAQWKNKIKSSSGLRWIRGNKDKKILVIAMTMYQSQDTREPKKEETPFSSFHSAPSKTFQHPHFDAPLLIRCSVHFLFLPYLQHPSETSLPFILFYPLLCFSVSLFRCFILTFK